jgi:hypothetical protein
VNQYLVTGKWDRHTRKFWIYARTQAEAEADAAALVRFYATGTKNFTTDTWRFGTITVTNISESSPSTEIRGSRPQLRVVR